MTTYNQIDYGQQFCDAVTILVEEGVNSAGYDKTISAQIIECVDSLKGNYKVKYQDAFYYATSDNVEVTYRKDTQVYILVPEGDFSKQKKIIGTVKDLGDAYIDNWNAENEYVVVGTNCAQLNGTKPLELCSYKTEKKTIYTTTSGVVTLKKDELKKYLVDSEKLRIGASFRTALEDEQRYQGNYGLKVKAVFYDEDSQTDIIKVFTLGVDNMEGMPYNFAFDTPQYLDFDIVGKNFKEIQEISLFTESFPVQNDEMPNDIYVTDIVIAGIAPPDAAVFTTYYLDLHAAKGTVFSDTESTLTLEAKLSLKNKPVVSNSLQYYWFRENASVTTTHDKYCTYGRQGWECLNEKREVSRETITKPDGSTEEKIYYEWLSGNKIYEVKKDNMPNSTMRFKCVCIYNNGSIIEKEEVISNPNALYDFHLVSSDGLNFIAGRGKTTLTLKNGENNPSKDLIYHWAKEDSSGNFIYLGNENEGNADEIQVGKNFDNSSLKKYLEILKTNYESSLNSTVLPTKPVSITDENLIVNGLSQEILRKLITELGFKSGDPTPTNQEVYDAVKKFLLEQIFCYIDNNVLYNMPARSIFNLNTFKCTIMNSNEELLGSSFIVLTNKGEATNSGYIAIENGNQVFKYNAEGVAPTDKNNKAPLYIQPLTISVYDEVGNEINLNSIKDEDITWIYPIENTLLKIEGEEAADDTKSEDGLTGFRHGKTFIYDIANTYKYDASNNVIKIEVKYNDKVFRNQTTFSFVKDGVSGTNGTDYFCKIIPTMDIGNAYPTIVYNAKKNSIFLNHPNNILSDASDQGRWFSIELWDGGTPISSTGLTTSFRILSSSSFDLENTGYFSLLKIEQTNEGYRFRFDNSKIEKLNSLDNVLKDEDIDIYNGGLLNILQAEVTYQGKKYFAELPIAVTVIESEDDYGIFIKPGTGYNEVVYAADGAKPQYASAYPFEVQVIKYEKDGDVEVSLLSNNETYKTPLKYDCSWTLGRKRYIKYAEKNNKYLTVSVPKDVEGNSIKNQREVKPSPYYDGYATDLGFKAIVTDKNDNSIGTLYFPIHFMLNKYGYSALNDWNGNSIEINEDGGYILTPQVGAGKKDSDTNTFTGVLMGEMKSGHDSGADIGLLGFHKGKRTIFLDAETGKAEFGATGSGQIILDPTNTDTEGRPLAQIYSGNYYNPLTGAADTGAGMLIDLTTPQIKFGSGTFEVNSEGKIKSTAGTIGGWNITDTRLWGEYKDENNQPYYSSFNLYKTEKDNSKPWSNAICIGSRKQGSTVFKDDEGRENANFTVSHTGILRARGAKIDGDIIAKSLQLTSGDESNVYIKKEVDENLNTAIQGLDPGNLAYTNRINVEPSIDPATGQVHTKITVSNPNGGASREWTTISTEGALVFNHPFGTPVDNDDIAGQPNTNGTNQSNKEGYVKISNEGLLTAHNAFIYGDIYANNGYFAGELKATRGTFANWTIEDNYISSQASDGLWTRIANTSKNNVIVAGATGLDTDAKITAAPFRVTRDGEVYATKGVVGGWNITDTRIWGEYENSKGNKFYNSFNLHKTGSDTSSPWANAICIGSTDIDSTQFGTDDDPNAGFVVTHEGVLKARGAVIKGNITATSGSFTGKIIATQGEIGGWTISTDGRLYTQSGSTYTALQGGDYTYAIRVGAKSLTSGDAPFWVKHTGEMKATSGTIGGWNLEENRLYGLSNTSFTNSSYLAALYDYDYNTTHKYAFAVWFNKNRNDNGKAADWDRYFSVSYNGDVYAKGKFQIGSKLIYENGDLSITGNINADSGYFGGELSSTKGHIGNWSLSTGRLYAKSGSTYTVLQSQYTYAIKVGATAVDSDAAFTVKHDGTLNIGNGQFIVTPAGDVTALSGSFGGTLSGVTGSFKNLEAGNSYFSSQYIKLDAGTKDVIGRIRIGAPPNKEWDHITMMAYKIEEDGTWIKNSPVGNLGTSTYPWDILYANNVNWESKREIKENIQIYNTNEAYEGLKNLPFYTFNYKNSPTSKLGTIIDFLPSETLFQEREDSDNQSFEITNLVFWDIAATQVIQQKLEETIQEKEILQNRLDILEQKFLEMEEKLNGFN